MPMYEGELDERITEIATASAAVREHLRSVDAHLSQLCIGRSRLDAAGMLECVELAESLMRTIRDICRTV
jgi:hypothetical protein